MGQSLLIAGIVCIIAAIAGGGIKLLGNEIPVLNSLGRQALLAIVGAALVGASILWNRPQSPPSPPPVPKNPRYVVWTYKLGEDERIAPNDLRFWSLKADNTWTETFPDGIVRNYFDFAGPFHLDINQCDGILLRRRDRRLLAFVPNDQCKARPEIYYEDVDPETGEAHDWRLLGVITKATY
jgi:hypothetical protein